MPLTPVRLGWAVLGGNEETEWGAPGSCVTVLPLSDSFQGMDEELNTAELTLDHLRLPSWPFGVPRHREDCCESGCAAITLDSAKGCVCFLLPLHYCLCG